MKWEDAARLAEAAQRGHDPDGETVVAWVGEAPTRFFVTFQPAPVPSIGGDVIVLPAIPHAGQWQVDRETGRVDWFHSLPETPGAEDYWAASTAWSHPALSQ